MSKVIIGIHGRSNKPDKQTLTKWWKQSIEEGLLKNQSSSLGNVDFEMVYYADIYYHTPVSNKENKEPYREAESGTLQRYEKRIIDRIRKYVGNWLDKPLDWLEEQHYIFSRLAASILKIFLKDLSDYYHDTKSTEKVKNRLKDLIIERQHDDIILVYHSMGSIIAYDVLIELQQDEDYKDIKIEHFITLGSPLGLTPVKGHILGFHKGNNYKGNLKTPSCVTKNWINFSDPQDYVCLDSHLADDFADNSFSVKVKDIMVCNDYPNNQHK